jgi:hypothetical protein
MKPFYQLTITKEQANLLEKDYKQALKQKEKELKEEAQRTKQPNKYTAKFYLAKDPTIVLQPNFDLTSVDNAILLLKDPEKTNLVCTFTLKFVRSKGCIDPDCIYMIDPDLTEQVTDFVHKNRDFIIHLTFEEDKHGLGYCSVGLPISCTVFDNEGKKREQVKFEIDDKYDLFCM